jgi:hypothetical protein
MVETISPVGYGDRTQRWLGAVALHALGATVTAAAFGAALGAAGALLHAPWGAASAVVVAVVAVVYAARELVGLPVPVPAARRQVPDWWRSFFSWPVAAALYGAGLGIGFLTFLTNGGLVVVAAAALASGRPATGAVLLGAFGLARGLSALLARPVRTREAGAALVDRLAASDPMRWRIVNGAALGLVAATAAATVLRSRDGVPDALSVAAAALVASAFAWSGTAKLVGPRSWRRTVDAHAFPVALARTAVVAVPVAELVVVATVVVGAPALASALALGLVASFSAAVVRARVRGGGDAVPCGCFGGSRVRDYRLLLARNAALAGLAAIGLGARSPVVVWWPGTPAADELVPFAFATSAAGVAVLTAWRTVSWLGRARHA